jgi:hypothetical protein
MVITDGVSGKHLGDQFQWQGSHWRTCAGSTRTDEFAICSFRPGDGTVLPVGACCTGSMAVRRIAFGVGGAEWFGADAS